MARITDHLSVADLEARYRAARETVEKSHVQAIWLVAKGHDVAEVAKLLAFTPRWVHKLIERYNVHGPDSLGDRRAGNGRTATLLTPAVLDALWQRLQTPPPSGGLWTGPKVAAWLAVQTGLESVHPQRGWEALRKIGWSIQTPRPRHARAASDEERAAFKKSSTPPSRKNRRRRLPGDLSKSGRATNTASV